jgi:hypothetical protein
MMPHNSEDTSPQQPRVSVFIDQPYYSCMEDVGRLEIVVRCERIHFLPAQQCRVTVNYTTVDGSAHDKSEYEAVAGTFVFAPDDVSKSVHIPIIDNDTYIEDAQFKFQLTDVKATMLTPTVKEHGRVSCAEHRLAHVSAGAFQSRGVDAWRCPLRARHAGNVYGDNYRQ